MDETQDTPDTSASTSAQVPPIPPAAPVPQRPSFGARMKRFWGSRGMTLFGAVVLPVLAFALGVCLMFDPFANYLSPMPNWGTGALVAFVILANLFLWIAAGSRPRRGFGFMGTLNAAAATVSLFFCVKCIPHMFVGGLAAVFGFWYFGLGLIGLLAYAPLTSFIYGIVLRRRLAAIRDKADNAQSAEPRPLPLRFKPRKLPGLGRGILIGIVLVMLGHAQGFVSLAGVRMAASPDPSTATRGVKLLRAIHAGDDIHNVLHGPRSLFFNVLSRTTTHDIDINPDILYYQVTGQNPEYRGSRRGFRSRFDFHRGDTTIGGVLEGLSLDGSVYETAVDASCGLGYAEWTMTFGNAMNWDQEARARLVLPHGAVVSRLTLWVNGEEQEAAFGGRGETTAAYQSVVRRNRDPVLVTSCGPDQVMVQCFPVTHGDATMKIRLGLTIPLSYRSDGSAILPTPVFAAANFAIPPSLLGMPEAVAVPEAASRLAPVAFCPDALSGTNAPMAIVQQAAPAAAPATPGRWIVVVDGSAALRPHADAIFDALAPLAWDGGDLWFVGDEPPKAPVPLSDAAKALSPRNFAGGRFSLHAIAKAVRDAERNGGKAQILWIHGPQPVAYESAEALAAMLRNAPDGVSFTSFQVVPGPCRLLASLDGVPRATALAWADETAADAGLADAIHDLAAPWAVPQIKRSRVPAGDVPADAEKAGDHIGRLWALEEVLSTYRPGKPTTLAPAKEIACGWRIVSPVSGAVVLENEQQFQQNGLEQVNPESVPTVPEPGDVACLLAVALVLAFCLFRLKKRRAAF